jgi:hypothetical protein
MARVVDAFRKTRPATLKKTPKWNKQKHKAKQKRGGAPATW